VTIVPVDDGHVPVILDWFEAEHVARWWGDPRVNASELIWHRAAGGGSGCRVICADGVPVGYLQWTEVGRYFSEDRHGLPPDTVDIDILIGDAAMTGQGVGSRALALAVETICADVAPPLISLVAAQDNARAIAAYEKIGFSRQRLIDDDTGPAVVMTLVPGG
jgi:aminoglycoside 6'-N-acetyltransferase